MSAPKKKPRGVFERPRGSRIFWIQYFDQVGRRHREKVGSKSVAIAAYQKRKSEIREGRFFPESIRHRRWTFADLAADAMKYSRDHKLHWREDELKMQRLLAEFGRFGAERITPQDVERYLSHLVESGRSPSTANRYRSLLSLVFSIANRNEKLSGNPARLVRARRENSSRMRWLSPEEESRLRGAIRAHYPRREPDFDLALHTGMRRGELYGMRWSEVDLERGVANIPRSKHGESRKIFLNSAARAALTALRSQATFGVQQPTFHKQTGASRPSDRGPAAAPLNARKSGKTGKSGLKPAKQDKPRAERAAIGPPAADASRALSARVCATETSRWFQHVRGIAGLPDVKWHDLRHTFASRLVMAGVDLRTVQELLGHKTIAMTLRYSHLAPQHQLAAVEKLVGSQQVSRTLSAVSSKFGAARRGQNSTKNRIV